jgi:ketosteroid isomerase-like protein
MEFRSASDRASIDELNRRFSRGFELGDPSLIASIYASDSVLFPPDVDMVEGLEAIESYWREVMDSGVKRAELETMELTGEGEFLLEKGTGVLEIAPYGGKPQERRLKYVVVWKRTADGWRNHWDIWNWSP